MPRGKKTKVPKGSASSAAAAKEDHQTTESKRVRKTLEDKYVDMPLNEFFQGLEAIDFQANELLNVEEFGPQLLGPLYKAGVSWPIIKTNDGPLIDMRLAHISFFYQAQDPDAVRHPATVVAERLVKPRKGDFGCFAFVAAAGLGKTSALADLGRKHYVVLLDASILQESALMARTLRPGRDESFKKMYEAISGDLSEDREDNWWGAYRRCKIEVLARILQLLVMKQSLKRAPLPWEFTVHQFAGHQPALKFLVDALLNLTEESIQAIMDRAIKELSSMMSKSCKLVFSVDAMDVANELLPGRLQRPGSKEECGLLSPLVRVIRDLSKTAKVGLVLAGTSEETLVSISSDIGRSMLKCTLYASLDYFPTMEQSEVIRVLSHLDADFNARDTSLVGRVSLVCGAIECVAKCEPQTSNKNDVLSKAIRMCLTSHKTFIENLLTRQLDLLIEDKDKERFLNHLVTVNRMACLAGRKGGMNKEGFDLNQLGLPNACSTYEDEAEEGEEGVMEKFTEYTISEQFIMDVLDRFLKSDKHKKFPGVKSQVATGDAMMQQLIMSMFMKS